MYLNFGGIIIGAAILLVIAMENGVTLGRCQSPVGSRNSFGVVVDTWGHVGDPWRCRGKRNLR